MNELRKAAEMALEALEWNYGTDLENIENCTAWLDKLNATIPALRQALEQPRKETFTLDRGCYERGCVAYDERDGDAVNISAERVDETDKFNHITVVCHKDHDKGYEDYVNKCLLCVVDDFGCEIGRLNKQVEELTGLYHLQSQRAMDYAGAFMRSETLVQPQQEPVAYYYESSPGNRGVSLYKETEEWQPLYTAPPKREWVGLTDNEARMFYEKYPYRGELIYAINEFLKEKNGG